MQVYNLVTSRFASVFEYGQCFSTDIVLEALLLTRVQLCYILPVQSALLGMVRTRLL